MKTAVWITIGSASAVVALCVRRILRVRRAKHLWDVLARGVGLDAHPPAFFRVAITGSSSGIGQACVSLLEKYPAVSIVMIGRQSVGENGIRADLCDTPSVLVAAKQLANDWYGNTEAPSVGKDIFINNAGVFTSDHVRSVWQTNVISPCYITESLARHFCESASNHRMLRVVQVGSRMEKSSALTRSNVRDIALSALRHDNFAALPSAYADTKRCLLLHAAFMSQFYAFNKSLSFFVVTPGMVNTKLGFNSAWRVVWWLTAPIRALLLRHPIEGAVAVLFAAFGFEGRGGLYTADPGVILESITETRDAEAGRVVSTVVNEYISEL